MQDEIEDGLKKAFAIEELNGFGFQVRGIHDPNLLAFARVSETPNGFQDDVRSRTGSKTLELRDFIGNEYLVIHFSEWALIPKIFAAAIEEGCSAIWPNILNLRPMGIFEGEEFSFEAAELKTVNEFNELAKLFQDNWRTTFELCGSPKAMRRLYNWRTFEGKLFCIELCAKLDKPLTDKSAEALDALPWWYSLTDVDDACRKHKVLHHGEWSARDNKEESDCAKRQKKEESTDDRVECVVCHDAMADTLTLPCEHVVVCHTCSVKLAQTHWADNCVYCRQNITQVLNNDTDDALP